MRRTHGSNFTADKKEILGAFLSDSGLAYPVIGRLIDLRPGNAIPVSPDSASINEDRQRSVKSSVQEWYDEFGWQRNADGTLKDTACFSQSAPTDHAIYERLSHLSLVDRLQGGRFMLDAASGAIPYTEYLAYSWNHKYRVCVDFSETALHEADNRVGDHGFFCLADICSLPFADGVFDGAVSGYTIQHIPEQQQERALQEIFRVLSPGHHMLVMSGVAVGTAHRILYKLTRGARTALDMLRIIRRAPCVPGISAGEQPPHELYCKYRDVSWWRKTVAKLSPDASIQSLRLFSKMEFEALRMRRSGIKSLRAIETLFPRLLGRYSVYILADIVKPIREDNA